VLSAHAKNFTCHCCAGSNTPYENRTGVSCPTIAPRGVTESAPRNSSVSCQSCSESARGVTTIVSSIVPELAETAATPRRPTIRHLPSGPKTARRSGTACVLSTGQSFGERQSYGPHSSTMIADRSTFAFAERGTSGLTPSILGAMRAYSAGNGPIAAHGSPFTASAVERTTLDSIRTPEVSLNTVAVSTAVIVLPVIAMSRVFAPFTPTRFPLNVLDVIRAFLLFVSRCFGYPQSPGSTLSPHSRTAVRSPSNRFARSSLSCPCSIAIPVRFRTKQFPTTFDS
jgi:hypothetical protein